MERGGKVRRVKLFALMRCDGVLLRAMDHAIMQVDKPVPESIDTQASNDMQLSRMLRRFLNPEDLGYAVTPDVRDDVRQALGMDRVEQSTLEQ